MRAVVLAEISDAEKAILRLYCRILDLHQLLVPPGCVRNEPYDEHFYFDAAMCLAEHFLETIPDDLLDGGDVEKWTRAGASVTKMWVVVEPEIMDYLTEIGFVYGNAPEVREAWPRRLGTTVQG